MNDTGTNPSEQPTTGTTPEAIEAVDLTDFDAFVDESRPGLQAALAAASAISEAGWHAQKAAQRRTAALTESAITSDAAYEGPMPQEMKDVLAALGGGPSPMPSVVYGRPTPADLKDALAATTAPATAAAGAEAVQPLDELADEVTAFWVIAERARQLKESRLTELRWRMLDRYEAEKVDRVGVYLDQVQTVSWAVTKPTPGPKLTRPDAFTTFCAEHYPDQVQMVFEVMASFQKALFKRLERVPGTDAMVDPMTGLIVEGVEWQAPKPSAISPSFKPDGKDRTLEHISKEDIANMLATVFQLGWEIGE